MQEGRGCGEMECLYKFMNNTQPVCSSDGNDPPKCTMHCISDTTPYTDLTVNQHVLMDLFSSNNPSNDPLQALTT